MAKREDTAFLKESFKGKMVKSIGGLDRAFKKAVDESVERMEEMMAKIRKENELKERKEDKERRKVKEIAQRRQDFELELSSSASEVTDDDNFVPESPQPKRARHISASTKVALHVSLDNVLE